MPDFTHLIPETPSSLPAAEAAAYAQRRKRCLWSLSAAIADYPDYVPDEYYLALCRGEVAGRWSYQQLQQMLTEHYRLLAIGDRHALFSDRLYDIRLDYHQQGEGQAVSLLGAVYDAWRANYQAPALPIFGPFLAGQTHDQAPVRVYTRLECQTILAQACAQLQAEERQRWQERRPTAVFPMTFGRVDLSGFAEAVLRSYLLQEVTAHQAKQLLAQYDEKPLTLQ